ncbi:hypothetical protein D0501_01300 [Leuconostoc holzapfelii]|uniref:Bacteriocin n=1 Tax=Leuconostoc holzapfelii TaxID=434464 RepID=A0ABT2NWJ4_9LACO|nr:hypothetical protein [Leuconostoc holzapfelii]MCT8388741.1 hypothetical protein [Leuconostoc holzapfelii]
MNNKLNEQALQGFSTISEKELELIAGSRKGFDWHCTFGSVGAALSGGLALGPYGVLAGGATGMATFCK